MKRMRSASNGAVIINKAAKRPVDKKVITVAKSGITTTAVTTTLFTAAAPCTLNGLIFSCGASPSGPLYWFVIRVDEGDTTNAISVTDGNASYTPESDILLSGVFPVNATVSTPINLATTHAKRKLMIGDRIIFVARTSTSTANFDGICTMFFKY